MSIKLPFKPSKVAQAIVAIAAALGAIGADLLAPGVLPDGWSKYVASALTVIAAIAGFIQREKPLIDELDNLAE
ncbi:hypothetical protein [Mycobacterium palustre]|uniref:Holin n=1 Tax=Mycobacterium palustre TaxID=153971 RepID=A0A1X1ZTM1_9MYCO|nr:hypothetical protein [Mycobacterium palustre]MCV7100959.1 hypothetical protein [Mycobacterium palustre]ORW27034.1 hypothetical protein AWC19_03150 [Mycobacterium palustre]